MDNKTHYGTSPEKLASAIRANFGIDQLLDGLPLDADDVRQFRGSYDVADLIRRQTLTPQPGHAYNDSVGLDKLLNHVPTTTGPAIRPVEELNLNRLLGCMLVTYTADKKFRDKLGLDELKDSSKAPGVTAKRIRTALGVDALLGNLHILDGSDVQYRRHLGLNGEPSPTLSMIGFQLIMGAAIWMETCAQLIERKEETFKVDWQIILGASTLYRLGSEFILMDTRH